MDPEQGPQGQDSPEPQYPQEPQYTPEAQYAQQQAPPHSPPQGQYPPPGQYPPQQQYPPPQQPPQHPRRRDEKGDEKQGEKEQEKQQEKGRGMDEKYRRNPLGFVTVALLVIWLGVTLLLQNAGVIDDNDQGWAVFLWGGGALILLTAVLRLVVPRWRRPIVGSIVWGAIWLGVGFGLYYDAWEVIGPIVIIAIGVAILVGRLAPRR
jgi:hypothetical protein